MFFFVAICKSRTHNYPLNEEFRISSFHNMHTLQLRGMATPLHFFYSNTYMPMHALLTAIKHRKAFVLKKLNKFIN